uniref:NADH dehydrogenase subunit 4L n=1 Tax=Schlettererius cinctipes TaxID=32424 RepID=C4NCG4_9HYME|nr:NADH dehydrogenase subunit 4L [Schlettererius cinctipes]
MENYNVILCLFMFICSLMIMFTVYEHFLMMLVGIEFLMLSLTYEFFIYLNLIDLSMYLMIYYFIIMVCESVLGLSILVIMVRFNGDDYIKLISLF